MPKFRRDVQPLLERSIDSLTLGLELFNRPTDTARAHAVPNLSRDFPQVVGENFTNESKERWATDFKILLQRRDVTLPRDRELLGQVHAIKRRVLPSGKVSFDAERNARGHTDKFWAVALACQKERTATGLARARSACGCWGDCATPCVF
jgi:hypothetical protein